MERTPRNLVIGAAIAAVTAPKPEALDPATLPPAVAPFDPFPQAREHFADLRTNARAALADDLLHDWSKDQPSGSRIWS